MGCTKTKQDLGHRLHFVNPDLVHKQRLILDESMDIILLCIVTGWKEHYMSSEAARKIDLVAGDLF